MDADHSDETWIGGVRERRAEIVAELRDYLRRTLAKGFGRQL